jgi:hypothetical protein
LAQRSSRNQLARSLFSCPASGRWPPPDAVRSPDCGRSKTAARISRAAGMIEAAGGYFYGMTATDTETGAEAIPFATANSVAAPGSIPTGTVKLVDPAAPGVTDIPL